MSRHKVAVVTGLGRPVRVVRGDTGAALGSWDDGAGTITLRRGLNDAEALVILLHESMHVVESMMVQNGAISRRVNHDFIEGAAFGLATLLVGAGMAKVTPRQWRGAVARMRKPKEPA